MIHETPSSDLESCQRDEVRALREEMGWLCRQLRMFHLVPIGDHAPNERTVMARIYALGEVLP